MVQPFCCLRANEQDFGNKMTFEASGDKYCFLSVLGTCFNGFGVVQLAKHVPSEEMVAVKRFNMEKLSKNEAALIQQEIVLTKQLQHPNIITYYVAYVKGPEVHVVSPLMGFGSCRDLINAHFNEGLPENAIGLLLKDILEGLDYMHRRGYIHRAVRASHVLIAANGQACISGLRYSCPIVVHGKWQKRIHSFPLSTTKNLNWLSPEVIEQNLKGYNEKSDIYSVGVVICELANGAEPFSGVSTTLMLTEKVRGSAPQLSDCTTLPYDEHEIHGDVNSTLQKQANRRFSEGLHQLNALCLQKFPNDRPTASQLLAHPYFKISRRGFFLPELLKPAIPLGDRVAFNSDELAHWENIQTMSDMELHTCEWDF